MNTLPIDPKLSRRTAAWDGPAAGAPRATTSLGRLRSMMRIGARAIFALGAAALALGLSGVAQAQPATVDVAQGPLFAAQSRVNPNMVLSLSVEFPTTGASYRNGTYDNNVDYIGYWDHKACYDYVAASGAIPAHFKRRGAAINHQCGNAVAFSGNVLNWAAASAIDMLRYAMTGGDRIYDASNYTILQRAVLQTNYYNNGTYFPQKTINGSANLYTPFTNGTIYIYSCLDRIYFRSATGGGCEDTSTDAAYLKTAATGTNIPYFFARAEVCNSSEGPSRRDGTLDFNFCAKQPAGNYKPTGTMQAYADKMRFAAFGYLNEDSNLRYGGVLRAPMKYVGPKAFNAANQEIANVQSEWDANTGVFAVNPIPTTVGGVTHTRSGVVNYLNQFGRTGQFGKYKGFDPVSELYYEAIRYLQGKPSETANNTYINPYLNLNATNMDGFPVYPTWTDPIVQSCQKNFIVQIADAYTWRDKTVPGNTRATGDDAVRPADTNPYLDVVTWTNLVGAFENNLGTSYTDSLGRTQTANGNPNPDTAIPAALGTAPGGCCDASHYIAGLAYWANTQRIRNDKPDIRVRTFVINVDENGNGTIQARERRQQLYLAAKYGGFKDVNADGNPFRTSLDGTPGGTPVNNNTEWADGVDDNGLPKPNAFFLASNPDRMIRAIRNIFAQVASSSGSIGGGAISSGKITASGADVYAPSFDANYWGGTIKAFPFVLNPVTGNIDQSTTPRWDAGLILTGRTTAPAITPRDPASRNIWTMKADGGGIPFTWSSLQANLTAAQITALNTNFYSGTVDNLGADRIDYLRGVRTKEDTATPTPGPFRTRSSVLGDIINSGPVYVGAPSRSVQGANYASFYNSKKNRRPMVYVGANDGMLHAFDAGTDANGGREVFAYVPNVLIDKLPAYTSPAYIHRPYVDAPPAVAEAEVNSSWMTVLVSGMGGGAQGVFALDVTDPALSFGAANVLWEFTDKDDPDMGNVIAAPQIMKFKTGTNTFKWFAVVPSGYNNYLNDGNRNTTGAQALFLLALEKADGVAWQLGVNYYKIPIPFNATVADTTQPIALSQPGALLGEFGEVKRLYMGDLQGNLWKLDFSGAPSSWSSGALAFGGQPLFTARDGLNNRQPITITPTVGRRPGGTAVVVFGTGKFIENSDLSNYKTQSMYGIWDGGDTTAYRVTGRTQLEARTMTAVSGGYNITGANFSYGTATGSKKGWYFDFPNSATTGERQVTNLAVSNNYVYFNTLIPNTDVCSNLGSGRVCSVQGATGLSDPSGPTCSNSTIGLLAAPIIVEVGDATVTSSDPTGKGTSSTRQVVVNVGTGDASGRTAEARQTRDAVETFRRLQWREITDFQRVRN